MNGEPDRMTDRQRAFVAAYLTRGTRAYLCATRAAAAADYRWPDKQGSRLMTFPIVKAAIDAGLTELRKHELESRGTRPAYRPVRRWRPKGWVCM